MADFSVDTNVLVVSSTAEEISPSLAADHVPPEEAYKVFEWLRQFRKNDDGIILDYNNLIMREYRNRLTEQDYGLKVILEKLTQNKTKSFMLSLDENGNAILPPELQSVSDLSDRKFVAVIIADRCRSTLVNACDTDWYDCREELQKYGIEVIQLLDDWCTIQWNRKHQA